MPKPLVDLFVFDIAGTTVKDDNVVHRAFDRVIERNTLSVPDGWIRDRMGWNKVQVFAEALAMSGRDTGPAEALATEFTGEIISMMDESPPAALPGAAESLRALRAAGVMIAFNTGYSAALATEIIHRMGWAPDAIVGSDLVPHGRPAPDMIRLAMERTGVGDPSRVGVVGDTPSDLQAGTAAGCRFVIGVGHGTFSLHELRRHPHTNLVPDLRSLPELLNVVV